MGTSTSHRNPKNWSSFREAVNAKPADGDAIIDALLEHVAKDHPKLLEAPVALRLARFLVQQLDRLVNDSALGTAPPTIERLLEAPDRWSFGALVSVIASEGRTIAEHIDAPAISHEWALASMISVLQDTARGDEGGLFATRIPEAQAALRKNVEQVGYTGILERFSAQFLYEMATYFIDQDYEPPLAEPIRREASPHGAVQESLAERLPLERYPTSGLRVVPTMPAIREIVQGDIDRLRKA